MLFTAGEKLSETVVSSHVASMDGSTDHAGRDVSAVPSHVPDDK